ncbi:endonuclease/exonuclease/phosphatase family protein [Bailinhaonella thermotolerans]|uniref:Endonuclease/exonuclease/phosphatase family protein n=1 Tax=Bailinhaonella thermotolerans TaxID=1070861 RepID=A0A3A4APT1_9ACTN|nr:endonuclease/exonuclease/phosphatase family protein [Bailinhaonella thermotolerans]RJL21420.1 endonuclease/exonuclease/phosphatase family protein [Bailinhaonella thermotolerans]
MTLTPSTPPAATSGNAGPAGAAPGPSRTVPDRPVRRGGRRRLATVLAWAAALPFAAWAVLRLGGVDAGFRWAQLVAFTPYVAAASGVAAPAVLALRRWAALAVAVAAAVALGSAVLPRAIADGTWGPAPDGPVVRVLTANLLMGQASAAGVVERVRLARADVLAVQELTPGAVERLEEAGLGRLLPYRKVLARDGVGGSGVYARFPVEASGPAIDFGGFGQLRAWVRVPEAPAVEVVSVHPCAPARPDREPCWKAGLEALPRPGDPGDPRDTADTVRILAGDFNATLDHRPVRDLLDAGYRDAADATGRGLTPTWPELGPWVEFTPGVTLDRVLADADVAVRRFETYRLEGADHRMTFAELQLPD